MNPESMGGTPSVEQKEEMKKRILVVDDEPSIRAMYRELLESQGYEVDTAVNGKIAKEKVQNGIKYHLIISDINMPEMNGVDFVKWVRSESEDKDTPVIIQSGNSNVENQIAGLRAIQIDKPVTPEKLLGAIKQVFS